MATPAPTRAQRLAELLGPGRVPGFWCGREAGACVEQALPRAAPEEAPCYALPRPRDAAAFASQLNRGAASPTEWLAGLGRCGDRHDLLTWSAHETAPRRAPRSLQHLCEHFLADLTYLPSLPPDGLHVLTRAPLAARLHCRAVALAPGAAPADLLGPFLLAQLLTAFEITLPVLATGVVLPAGEQGQGPQGCLVTPAWTPLPEAPEAPWLPAAVGLCERLAGLGLLLPELQLADLLCCCEADACLVRLRGPAGLRGDALEPFPGALADAARGGLVVVMLAALQRACGARASFDPADPWAAAERALRRAAEGYGSQGRRWAQGVLQRLGLPVPAGLTPHLVGEPGPARPVAVMAAWLQPRQLQAALEQLLEGVQLADLPVLSQHLASRLLHAAAQARHVSVRSFAAPLSRARSLPGLWQALEGVVFDFAPLPEGATLAVRVAGAVRAHVGPATDALHCTVWRQGRLELAPAGLALVPLGPERATPRAAAAAVRLGVVVAALRSAALVPVAGPPEGAPPLAVPQALEALDEAETLAQALQLLQGWRLWPLRRIQALYAACAQRQAALEAAAPEAERPALHDYFRAAAHCSWQLRMPGPGAARAPQTPLPGPPAALPRAPQTPMPGPTAARPRAPQTPVG